MTVLCRTLCNRDMFLKKLAISLIRPILEADNVNHTALSGQNI